MRILVSYIFPIAFFGVVILGWMIDRRFYIEHEKRETRAIIFHSKLYQTGSLIMGQDLSDIDRKRVFIDLFKTVIEVFELELEIVQSGIGTADYCRTLVGVTLLDLEVNNFDEFFNFANLSFPESGYEVQAGKLLGRSKRTVDELSVFIKDSFRAAKM